MQIECWLPTGTCSWSGFWQLVHTGCVTHAGWVLLSNCHTFMEWLLATGTHWLCDTCRLSVNCHSSMSGCTASLKRLNSRCTDLPVHHKHGHLGPILAGVEHLLCFIPRGVKSIHNNLTENLHSKHKMGPQVVHNMSANALQTSQNGKYCQYKEVPQKLLNWSIKHYNLVPLAVYLLWKGQHGRWYQGSEMIQSNRTSETEKTQEGCFLLGNTDSHCRQMQSTSATYCM